MHDLRHCHELAIGLVVLALAACDDGSRGTTDGGHTDGDGSMLDAAGGEDSGGGDAGDAGSDEEGVPYCVTTCATAADCARDDAPAHEAKNYECDDGFCSWLGCLSDDDCAGDSVCSTFGTVPSCVVACGDGEVCGAGHPDPILDEDNWECVDGGCKNLGCHPGECVERHDEQWTCTEALYGFPNCLKRCSTASDCAPDYDWADVVGCLDGFCVSTCDDTSCDEGAVCR